MKKNVCKIIGILNVLLVTIISTQSPVFAESSLSIVSAEKALMVSCEADKNEYKPYEELVVIDLRKYLTDSSFAPEDLNRELFYEFVYVKNRKLSPFNAIYSGGTLYMQQCDRKDLSSRVLSDNGKGMFIIGVTEDIGVDFQSKIDDANLVKFYQANLVETGVGIRVEDKKDCGNFCRNIKPATKSWKDRIYEISIDKVAFNETVDQKDFLDVSIFVTNSGVNPIYGDSTAPLYVETIQSQSPFYDQSWISADKTQKNSGVLLPGQKAELKFKLNSPLKPGDYEQKFKFAVGSVGLKTDEVRVAFKVVNNNFKLGVIRPKDNMPFARVRESQSLKSNELFRLDPGTIVIINKDEGAWLNISTKQGKSGWIYRPNIRELS